MAPAAAQTALLREADPSPDGTVGQVISSIGTPSVNQLGGASCSLTTSGPNGSTSQFWGNLTGGASALLLEESTVGTLEQTVFEARFGTTGSSIVYGATANDTATGINGLDNVWLDDTLLMNENDSVPGTTDFWTFAQNADVTTGGEPYFRGGVSTSPGGSTDRRGIFFGTPLAPIYFTGDLLPNMPFVLSDTAVDADFRLSSNGTHSILNVDLDSGSTLDDGAMAIDQVGLVLGGTLVREGEIIPVSVGGTGDAWDNFDYFGITEAGQYIFTGDTDGSSTADEFIVRNGLIWAREGDTLDGEVLSGSLSGASMNESGSIAFVWGIDDGPGAPADALYLEDELLLLEGDAVDWDGDGAIDPGFTIQSFTGTNTVTLAEDGTIFFTADVDAGGITLEGYFIIGDPAIDTSYCGPANVNSTGASTILRALGSDTASTNNVTLAVENMPLNQFGYFITSQTQGFVANPSNSEGNLCLIGNIGRYNTQIFTSGTTGTTSFLLDLTNTPQPAGSVAIVAGQTWNFQCWHRDANPQPTSNFSQGVSILFQ